MKLVMSYFYFHFIKGQLISKCLLGLIVWTKIPTQFFPGFLPQSLKRGQIKKIKALYYTNQGLFDLFGILKFLIQPLFRGQGRKSLNKFRWLFGRNDDKKKAGNSKILPRSIEDSRCHDKFVRFCLLTRDIQWNQLRNLAGFE